METCMEPLTRELFSCLWELTLKCNLNCMHCGSVAGAARVKELSDEECHQVCDELIALGCKEVTFIGGEIFLYPGWEKVGRYLSDQGVSVNIMTNGYRFNNKHIDQIQYAKLTNVGISLDGLEQTHNTIRRKKDSFSEILHSFNLLNEAGISIGVVTSLIDMNLPELEDLYVLLTENNVNLWQIQLVNPMGNMAKNREMILTRDKIPALTEFIYEKNKDRNMLIVAADNVGYFYENEPYIRGRNSAFCYWEGCQAGISSIFIDSTGNIKGCGALYDDAFIEGNIRNSSIREIWNDENNFSYNRAFHPGCLTGNCTHCELGDVCQGGCRASNFFTSGSLYSNTICNYNLNGNRHPIC